jgi:hypothetical protein
LIDINTGKPTNLTYETIFRLLTNKENQMQKGKPNKYNDALNQLRKPSITTTGQVQNILAGNNIELKNGAIMGGRKSRKPNNKTTTKKHKKQRGGYIYSSSKALDKASSVISTSSSSSSKSRTRSKSSKQRK